MFKYVHLFACHLFLIYICECRVIPTHQGCYSWDGGFDMDGHVFTSQALTPEDCHVACFTKGFSHAALKNGNQCLCGDLENLAALKEDDNCAIPCAGNRKEVCGGVESFNLYSTGLKDVKIQNTRLGCVSNGAPERLIPQHKVDLPQTNSPQKCLDICASLGYKNAGLQRSYECYCGTAERLRPLETGCSTPCPSDPYLYCGGTWKMMIYKTGLYRGIPNTKIEYFACFKNKEGGFLRKHKFVHTEMDPYKCLAKCYQLGHPYAAIFNRVECQCGKMPAPVPEAVSEGLCSSSCPGNTNMNCGGPQHVSVYSTGIIGDPVMGRSIGCFRDGDGTLISAQRTDLGFQSSPRSCIAKCIEHGYMLAGVRNTYECVCGNDYPKNIPRLDVPDSVCNASCPRSSIWTCGAQGYVQAYRTGLDDMYLDRGCSKSASQVDGAEACSGDLLFEETFDNLSLSKWQRTVRISGEDYEFVTYNSDPRNSFIRHGRLVIKPSLMDESLVEGGNITLKGCTGRLNTDECSQRAYSFNILHPVQSAQLCTEKSFSFRYGVVTVRAKLSGGDWVYPQIFLKPEKEVYGPGYLSGRIIIASARGNDALVDRKGVDIGSALMEAGIIVASSVGEPSTVADKRVAFKSITPWHAQYHNYTLVWDQDSISFYVDNKMTEMKTVYKKGKNPLVSELGFTGSDRNTWKDGTDLAPFDEKFQICLGVSAGGSRSFPDGARSKNKLKPWDNYSVKAMLNFWKTRDDWLPTWLSNLGLSVDYVGVTAV